MNLKGVMDVALFKNVLWTFQFQMYQSGNIEGVEVSIDITHTYIGDLTVKLTSPRSSTFLLYNRSGHSQDNIIITFTPADTQILRLLLGKSIKRNWKLRVVDYANVDAVKLNPWKILFIL